MAVLRLSGHDDGVGDDEDGDDGSGVDDGDGDGNGLLWCGCCRSLCLCDGSGWSRFVSPFSSPDREKAEAKQELRRSR